MVTKRKSDKTTYTGSLHEIEPRRRVVWKTLYLARRIGRFELDEIQHWARCKSVLIDFTQKQWEKLEKEVLEKPEFWQQRCVVSLGEYRSDNAITILKFLLSKSPYKDVKILSAYELDWAEVPIEKKYANFIKKIINTIPSSEI